MLAAEQLLSFTLGSEIAEHRESVRKLPRIWDSNLLRYKEEADRGVLHLAILAKPPDAVYDRRC